MYLNKEFQNLHWSAVPLVEWMANDFQAKHFRNLVQQVRFWVWIHFFLLNIQLFWAGRRVPGTRTCRLLLLLRLWSPAGTIHQPLGIRMYKSRRDWRDESGGWSGRWRWWLNAWVLKVRGCQVQRSKNRQSWIRTTPASFRTRPKFISLIDFGTIRQI